MEEKTADRTEDVTVPEGTPVAAATPAAPAAPAAAPTPELHAFQTSAELLAFLRELRGDVDQLKAFYVEVNETQFHHAEVIGSQTQALDGLQAAIDRLVGMAGDPGKAIAPLVRIDAARTLPPGQPLPGGVVLPPLQAAPSLPPGQPLPGGVVLPPLRPAPSAGARPPAESRPRGGWLPPAMDVRIPIEGLQPGTHLIPASEATGGVAIELNVKRPGLGNLAAPRNPSPAFRRSR